jgi:hypothetical protein
MKRKTWRCFHCDDVFTSSRQARIHFGSTEGSTPGCLMGGAASLLEALREAEDDAGKAWAAIHDETTESAKAYYAQQSRHRKQLEAAEVAGYERGLRDAGYERESFRLAVEWCLERDERNGSLPEPYAEKLRAARSPSSAKGE